jgi:telomerase reverse transcriptase
LKDHNYQCSDKASVESIIGCRLFCFSKLRLLPTKNGVRMMENLKTSSTMPTKKSTSELYSFGMQREAQFFTNSVMYEHSFQVSE